MAPVQLIALKALSFHSRKGQPKGFSDMRDLAILFLTFPEMKIESGAVFDALNEFGATPEEIDTWRDIVTQQLTAPNEDDEFN